MRVMVIVKAGKESEPGIFPDEKFAAEMGKYNEQLVKAGVLLAAEGLYPSSKSKRIRFSGGKPIVIDGPFAETKELIGGFWIWKVNSMDEAIEWVMRCPSPEGAVEEEIDIRPIIEGEDFWAEFSPELQEQDKRMRAQAAANK
jgi:hypothetical protein